VTAVCQEQKNTVAAHNPPVSLHGRVGRLQAAGLGLLGKEGSAVVRAVLNQSQRRVADTRGDESHRRSGAHATVASRVPSAAPARR